MELSSSVKEGKWTDIKKKKTDALKKNVSTAVLTIASSIVPPSTLHNALEMPIHFCRQFHRFIYFSDT